MEKNSETITISKKWFFVGLIVTVVIIGFLLFGGNRGMKLSTTGVEITPPQTALDTSDSKSKQREDVAAVSTPRNSTSQSSSKETFATEKSPVKTTVKKGDTVVTVEGQPSNVNFGNNSVVGNNNSNITINSLPHLSDFEKQNLLAEINQNLKAQKKDKSQCIEVHVPANCNPDARYIGEDIEKLLVQNGYSLRRHISVSSFFPPTPENQIYIQPTEGSGCYQITVWMK